MRRAGKTCDSASSLTGFPGGVTPLSPFRIPVELNAKLDAWIEAKPEPKPSRSEAIRRLLERALNPG
jgi:hypothetical protein